MSKTIVIKLKKAGNRLTTFSLSDNRGNVLSPLLTKKQLISGVSFSVENEVTVLILTSIGANCCSKTWNLPISYFTLVETATIDFVSENTGSIWRHLSNPAKYIHYYGCPSVYTIEYPFSYEFNDQILQNVIDYTKVYKYLPSVNGVFDDNRRVTTNDYYFNKAVLYNDQQSSGLLELVVKPKNNLKAHTGYPKFNSNSKTILFTKSNNFYQFNTFWSIVKDTEVPLFTTSCESMSIDKVINDENMNYSTRSFLKAPLSAKDLKVRMTLDNNTEIHLVSQLLITPSQISYK